MLHRLRLFLEMIRFSHTLFALPFALASAALAWRSKGNFSWLELIGILLCMVFARSAAMAFNRLTDHKLDAENPRTAKRHLPAGLLSVSSVVFFLVLCSAGFIASTGLFLLAEPPNPWPMYLAVPVLLFICAYSWTKRFTALCHFWLGASLLLAPLAAWIAIRGLADLAIPAPLGFAVMFWVAGFDILYACQDVEYDRRAKLHSVPATLGVATSLRVAMLCHVLMLVCLGVLGWVGAEYLGWTYRVGVAVVAGLLVYEHSLVQAHDLNRVNQAFFHINGVISVGLLGIVLLQIVLGV